MLKNKFMYRIRCKGNNLSTLLSKLSSKGLRLIDVSKDNGLVFLLSKKDFEVFKTLNLKDYEVDILSYGGWYYAKHLILSRVGVFLGLVLSIALYFSFSNNIFYIGLSGNSSTEYIEVLEYLNEIGVSRFGNMPNDTESIENKLSSKFNFSLVSVVTKGNALIINVKEELQILESNGVDLIAEYDMVIKSIEVFSGTCNVKSGDIVKCGDVLVFGYMAIDGKEVGVEPKAKITATRYVTSSYTFLSEETKVERTGKKQVLSSDYCLGKYIIFKENNECDFEFYETEDCDVSVSEYFLPIRIKKTVAYEITDVVILHDFKNEKEDIINDLKNLCLDCAKGGDVESEGVDIIPMDFGYIINYHLGILYTFVN